MALLVAMVVVVLLGVLYRYAIDRSLVWYDEFASYILVWLTFVGAVAASWRGRQISFELVIERSGPKVARMLRLFAELCVLVFHVLIAFYGWNLMDRMGAETAVSIEGVKMSWIYGVLPASATLMALISLHRLVSLARGRETPPEGGVPSTGSSSE